MKVQIFNSPQFGEIRTTGTSEEPLFCASDVCGALGYQNPRKAVADHVDFEDVTKRYTPTSSGEQLITYVTESGLYSLIFGSKLDCAKQFKKWVTSEVLPSIRNTGGYIASSADDTPEEIMARALIVANDTIKKKEERVKQLEMQHEKDKPLVDFAEAAFKADGYVDIGQSTKILGLPFGRNTLFKLLRQRGIFFNERNEPKQQYVKAGYFKLTQLPPIKRLNHPDIITMKVLVTQKGLAFINTLFGGNGLIPAKTAPIKG